MQELIGISKNLMIINGITYVVVVPKEVCVEGIVRLVEIVVEVVLFKGNPVVLVVAVPPPKLNPDAVVVARGNPALAVVVVLKPVFEASNESPGVIDGTVLLGRFVKLGTFVGIDVVVVIVLLRPNPVAVGIAFGVPKVKPVGAISAICTYYLSYTS